MNLTQLSKVFEANYVPHAYYSFRGMAAGDCYVLEQKDGLWITYYSERGSRYEEKTYADEEQACEAMLALVSNMMISSGRQGIEVERRT